MSELTKKNLRKYQTQKLLTNLQTLLGCTLPNTEALAPITSKASYKVTLYPTKSLSSSRNEKYFFTVYIGLNYFLEMEQKDAFLYVNGIIGKSLSIEILKISDSRTSEVNQTFLGAINDKRKDQHFQMSEKVFENIKLPFVKIKEEYNNSGGRMTGEIVNLAKTLENWNKNITMKHSDNKNTKQYLLRSLSRNKFEVDTNIFSSTSIDKLLVRTDNPKYHNEENSLKKISKERYEVISQKLEKLALEEDSKIKSNVEKEISKKRVSAELFISSNKKKNMLKLSNIKKNVLKIESSNVHRHKNIKFVTKTIKPVVMERKLLNFDTLNNKRIHIGNFSKENLGQTNNKTQERKSRFLKDRLEVHKFANLGNQVMNEKYNLIK